MKLDIKTDCYSKCIFCVRYYGYDKNGYFDLEEMKREVLSNDEVDTIEIGGAEPLNYKYIKELVFFIKDKTIRSIKIKTSGVINDIDNFDGEFLKLVDNIEVPIYSLEEEKFNMIVGNREGFKKYNKFLDKLCKLGLKEKLKFHTVILKANFLEFPNLLLFLNNKFDIRILFLIYPRKINFLGGNSEAYDKIYIEYYSKTVEKKEVLTIYSEFIHGGMFGLINFDD